MTREALLQLLRECPLVASVQAADDSPVQDPETLRRLALASLRQGVKVLRLQGVATIRHVRQATDAPLIGLIKRTYQDSAVYITPTRSEVDEVIGAGAEVVALDGTSRARPHGARLPDLIAHAKQRGALVLADIDTPEAARAAQEAGADLVSTTLAGYTDARPTTQGPDFEVLRAVAALASVPVLAEGRFEQPWHVDAALRIGAAGVVVGGALNDPDKNTRRLLPSPPVEGRVGAVDIGGTWLRFGVFTPDWKLLDSARVPNPPRRDDRLAWIRAQIESTQVSCVGVSTGGIVDPVTGEVWTAKEYLMPDHIGIRFDQDTLGVPTQAFGDGHATAWGHACLPAFAGARVATLAIGTGVGCGFVQDGRIWCGRRGEYPRVNDLPAPGGATYEELLGGIHLTREPTESAKARAVEALQGALEAVRTLYFPDAVVVSGSVGLSPWLAPHLERLAAIPSPFGTDAGLYGAAALALFPRWR